MEHARKLAELIAPMVAYVAGLGLIAYGCWLVYEPAGLIVGGVLLSASALRYAAGEELSI